MVQDLVPARGYVIGEQSLPKGRRSGAVFQGGRLVEKAIGLTDDALGPILLRAMEKNTSERPLKLAEGAYCGYFLPFFGHLLTEFLPRYELYRILNCHHIPLLVHSAPWVPNPHTQLVDFSPIPEFLSELRIPFDQLHFCVSDVEIDDLVYAPNPIDITRSVSKEMAIVSKSLNARFNHPVVGRKIFLSRSRLDDRFRRSVNASEVDRIFKDFGFEVLHTQEMPFKEQIAAVCSASIIAGEEGSAMHLSMFNPSLKVCIILDSGRFTRIGAALDTQKLMNDRLDCETIYCLPEGGADVPQAGGRFTVDVAGLVKTLDSPWNTNLLHSPHLAPRRKKIDLSVERLIKTRWTFGPVDGHPVSKTFFFACGGRIQGYKHYNENSWEFDNDVLQIFDSGGRLSWRFETEGEDLVGSYQGDYATQYVLRPFFEEVV